MQVYAGSYHGQFIILEGHPTQLQLKVSKQVSENSLRTITCSEGEVYLGGFDQELRAYDASSGTETKESKESKGVITALVKVSSDLSVMGMDNGAVRFWNSREWGPRKEVRDHKKSVTDVKVDAKGKLLVSTAGKEMIFWNLAMAKPLYHYRFDFDIDQVLLVDSFQYLFLISGKVIRQIATQDNRQMGMYSSQHQIQCGLVFHNFLIVANDKGQVKVWNHGNFKHCLHFQAHPIRIKAIKNQEYQGVSYLVTADSSGEVRVWDVLEFLKEVEAISQDYPLEGLKPLCSVPTGQRIICMETGLVMRTQMNEEKKKQQQEVQEEQEQGHEDAKNQVQKVNKEKSIRKQQKGRKKHRRTLN